MEGQLVKVIYEAQLRPKSYGGLDFRRKEDIINGLESHESYVKTNFPLEKSELARFKKSEGK